MRSYIALIAIMMLLLAACSVQESDQYTEFTFDDTNQDKQQTPSSTIQEVVPEPVQTITVVDTPSTTQTTTTPSITPKPSIPSEKELFSCVKDADCVLVQPTTCCACPLAINLKAEKNFPTLGLGETPKCSNDYLCGSCASPEDLSVRCVQSKCKALLGEQVEELDKPAEVPESEIVRYPDPALDSESDFKSVLIKPTCYRDYPSVYLLYELKSPVVTTLEVREEGQTEFSTLKLEDKNLFKIEEKIVICPTCNILQYPVLRTDKKYQMRIKSEFNDKVTYTGNYIIDTHEKSEYIAQKC